MINLILEEYDVDVAVIELLIKEADRLKKDRNNFIQNHLEVLSLMSTITNYKDFVIKENEND